MLQLHRVQDAASWLRERVTGTLRADSRAVHAGDGLLAWPGAATDARLHVPAALAGGVAACLIEQSGAQAFAFDDGRVACYCGLKAASGPIASGYFDDPSSQLAVLAVTGTNGKTTTTSMLEAMCLEAGMAARACGNIGLPITDVLLAEPRVDVLAAELSSFQLHWAPSCRPDVGVVLNVAEDHLDWHGSMEAYAAAKAQVLTGRVAVAGAEDRIAARLLAAAPAATRIGVRLGAPRAGEYGVIDGVLAARIGDGEGDDDEVALLPAADRTAPMRSLVLVLPDDPVTPTTTSPCSATSRSTLARARRPSATRTAAPDPSESAASAMALVSRRSTGGTTI